MDRTETIIDLSTDIKLADSSSILRETSRAYLAVCIFMLLFFPAILFFLFPNFTPVELYQILVPGVLVIAILMASNFFAINKFSISIFCIGVLGALLGQCFLLFTLVTAPFRIYGFSVGVLLYVIGNLIGLIVVIGLFATYLFKAIWLLKNIKGNESNIVIHSVKRRSNIRGWLLEFLRLPPIWTSIRKKKVSIFMIVTISLLVEFSGFYQALYFPNNLKAVLVNDLKDWRYQSGGFRKEMSTDFNNGWIEPALSGIAFSIGQIGGIFLLLSGSAYLRRVARQRAINTLDSVIEKDRRPPLLFLRSFKDDKVQIPQSPKSQFLVKALMKGTAHRDMDNLISESFWQLGPVIAIGNPQDELPAIGAARRYVSGTDWLSGIAAIMKQACAIILVLDDTEGVKKELNYIASEPDLLSKVIIAIPPSKHNDGKFIQSSLLQMPIKPNTVNTYPPENTIGIMFNEKNEIIFFKNNSLTYQSYLVLFRIGLNNIIERSHQKTASTI